MAKPPTSARRVKQLRAVLEERRHELMTGLADLIRDVRAGSGSDRVADGQDGIDAEHRDDLDLALLQMRGETLAGIDGALRRLDAGTYGTCCDCDQPIAHERLRALPFAARCRSCEEAREAASTRRSVLTKSHAHHAFE